MRRARKRTSGTDAGTIWIAAADYARQYNHPDLIAWLKK